MNGSTLQSVITYTVEDMMKADLMAHDHVNVPAPTVKCIIITHTVRKVVYDGGLHGIDD